MIEGCLEVILARRGVMRVLANDPAMRTEISTTREFSAVRARLPVALFGEDPTPEQRFVVYAGLGLSDAVIGLVDLPENEIRRMLSDAIRRQDRRWRHREYLGPPTSRDQPRLPEELMPDWIGPACHPRLHRPA